MTNHRVADTERHAPPVVHLATGGRVPACLAVCDAGRARLFVLAEHEVPGTAGSIPSLREVADLQRPIEASPNQRAGHLADVDHKFAREIVTALTALLGEHGAARALFVASPKMLGIIRPLTEPLRQRDIEVADAALDLTDESTTELHDHLASRGLLPARHRQHGDAR